MPLSANELHRYARHLALPDFGRAGQERLKAAKVLVVGAGGLGSPLLLYLAAAGVGRLGIVDFDTIDETNLQRQVLFSVKDLGKPKAQIARERIRALNPEVEVILHETPLNAQNALDIIPQYDLVTDGTDNFPTRYLTNDACVLCDKPLVYGSIFRYEGQVSVFNLLRADGSRGPNYRDLFPTPPPPEMVPNCAEGGVLGVLPGIIGSMQANEALKILGGYGEPLDGKLLLYDAAAVTFRTLQVPKDPDLQITELIDYEEFCGIPKKPVPEISVAKLRQWQRQARDHQLIDVRETYEREIRHIGGLHLPKDQIGASADQIARDRPVVLYCRSGKRSADALHQLREEWGFENLFSLAGGMEAWMHAKREQEQDL